MEEEELANTLFVDLSARTGPVKHGACGFLYGLGKAEIPSVNTLAPLKPQVAAQKPEGGLQHPNSDALNVSETYKAAGGREIEIYIQDVYPNWPYDSLGINDYLGKVEQVVSQVIASPNRSLFSYVPFNEPDQIWYNKTDKKQAFFDDWQTVYRKIKSIDAQARLVGPNLANYDSAFYWDFMAFASQNDCLPDVVSWHELNDDFFSGWYQRFDDFRRIESDLGLPAREICINEYCRIKGDLGIPGQLIQWMTRFENSKVDACLAYWTTAGCLNDLVARDSYNQATGGWWLYKWYGSLTGNTIKVTPPDGNAEGLQGLASLDSEKQQARALFGGSNGDVDILIKGFGPAPYFGERIHAAVWATVATGTQPAKDPVLVMEGDYVLVDGETSIPIKDTLDTTAYQVIITAATALSSAGNPDRYEAEYADLRGDARILYGGSPGYSGTGFVQCGKDASTSFIVTADKNGFYNVTLRYSAGSIEGVLSPNRIHMILNGSPLLNVPLPATADWDSWADININMFLTMGINCLTFETVSNTGAARHAVRIDYIEVTAGSGAVDTYEAEAQGNTLSGTAKVMDDPSASGGRYVCQLGNGMANTLQFNHVNVPTGGTYRMVVHFANAERKGAHEYNTQVVDRYADVCVNEGSTQRVYFRNTFSWNTYRTRVIDVNLKAGSNTIEFFNSSAHAPHIDKIEIASRF